MPRRPIPRKSTTKVAQSIEDLPLICTAEEAASLLRCKPETIRKMARAKQIPAAQINRKWLFKREDLVEYFDHLLIGGNPT